MRHLSRLASASIVIALVAGCGSFRGLERDLEKLGDKCEAHISLENESHRESPHVVVLVDAQTKVLANVAILHGSGEVEMTVPVGSYYLAAYEDRNENLRHDDGELARFHGAPTAIEFSEEGQRAEFSLVLRESDTQFNAEELALVGEMKASNAEITINNLGTVASLDDERFAPEFGEQGMWEPAKFIEGKRHGLYMLEEYDPARVPIIFVHGVGGTPRDFSGMIGSIDRTQFQPWVFYYPSALRLADLGQYLLKSIDLMLARHQAERYILVAHSMGGLVSTEAVQLAVEAGSSESLQLFVTIASPLGGIPSAAMGVEWSPTVMPCWYDLSPGSPFLGQLYRTDTHTVPYFLAFAYERGGFGGESSDGTVPLHSQLRLEAQARALNVFGVDSDHVGVLSDPATLEWINALFAEYGAK